MHRLLLLIALLLQLHCYCQNDGIDPLKRDSLARAIEASRKNLRASQDSFLKVQDSMYQAAQRAAASDQNTRNSKNLMAGNREREGKRKKQAYLRIAIGVLLFVVLIIGLTRRKHRSSKL